MSRSYKDLLPPDLNEDSIFTSWNPELSRYEFFASVRTWDWKTGGDPSRLVLAVPPELFLEFLECYEGGSLLQAACDAGACKTYWVEGTLVEDGAVSFNRKPEGMYDPYGILLPYCGQSFCSCELCSAGLFGDGWDETKEAMKGFLDGDRPGGVVQYDAKNSEGS